MTEGAALAGRFVYTQEGERLPAEGRARRNPPSSPHPRLRQSWKQRGGDRKQRCPLRLPEKVKLRTCVSFSPRCFPFQMVLPSMSFFIVPFSSFQGLFMSGVPFVLF